MSRTSSESPSSTNDEISLLKRSYSKRILLVLVPLILLCIALLAATAVYMVLYYDHVKKVELDFIMSTTPPQATSNSSLSKDLTPQKPFFDSLQGEYMKGAVAADNIICSEVGRNIILKGGNAVDAAVATLFCIGAVHPQSSGLGGGHMMTIYNSTTKKCHVVDARTLAGEKAHRDMFKGDYNASISGWKSVAVPGELAGLWAEYTSFGSGRVPWKDLVQPAADLIKNGFPVSFHMQHATEDEFVAEGLRNEPSMSWVFNTDSPGGQEFYKAGDVVKTRQKYASFMQMVADCGDPKTCKYAKNPHDLFYNSKLAKEMTDEFSRKGGILTLDDLKNYKPIIRDKDEIIYAHFKQGRVMCGPPPPSSASAVMSILKILDSYDHQEDLSFEHEVDTMHRFIEASKFAFATRLAMGDVYYRNDSLDIAKQIVSDEWVKHIKEKITDKAHDDSYYVYKGLNNHYLKDGGTTHVSVIDEDGNAVSVTSTVNLYFGAHITSESTGVLWNGEMDAFSIPGLPNYFNIDPAPANYIEPGKRPMSSTSPIIAFNKDGNVEDLNEVSVYGSAGGSTIISAVAAIAYRNLWQKREIKEAVDFPRLYNQYKPNNTNYEYRLPESYVEALLAKGHNMTLAVDHLGVPTEPACATAINKPSVKGLKEIYGTDKYKIYANSDFRKDVTTGPAGF